MQDIATEKITTIKDNVPQVYASGKQKGHTEGYNAGYAKGETAGHEAGRAEGYNDGFTEGYSAGEELGRGEGYNVGKAEGEAAGRQAEHSSIWGRLQQNGATNQFGGVTGFFNGVLFGFNNFYPDHDIKPVGTASYLFYNWANDQNIKDHTGSLDVRLKECGIVLDTSKATLLTSAFNYNRMDDLPPIDVTGLSGSSTSVFANSYTSRKTIQLIKTKESVTYTNWFQNATGLINVAFEGVIGKSIDFSYSTKLAVASMKSVLTHLKNYAGTASEFTYTVRFPADRWAALEADSTAPDGGTWEDYVESLGWLT